MLITKLLGNRLKNVKFEEIFSSDLNQIRETLKLILAFRENNNINFDPRLRDRSCGIFEGKSTIDLRKEAIVSKNKLKNYKTNYILIL